MPGDRTIQVMFSLPEYGVDVPENQRHRVGDIIMAGHSSLITEHFAILRSGRYISRKPVLDKKLVLVHIRNIPDFIIDNLDMLTLPVTRRNLNIRPDEPGGIVSLAPSRYSFGNIHSRIYTEFKRRREVTVNWDQIKAVIIDLKTNISVKDRDFEGWRGSG